MLTDGQWTVLEPVIEACRPAKVAPQNLRQTMSAILWRHQNRAKWRAVPEMLGSWKAAQHIWNLGARPVIPTPRHEETLSCPPWIYANRNQVE
jgi:transposase